MKDYWNSRYQQTQQEKLGWYEAVSQPSLDLIDSCYIAKDALIVDIGSGASLLIDNLIDAGYRNLVATDISDAGLAISRDRLGDRVAHVRFIVDDICQPLRLTGLRNVAIWHDRAVLHFFTQEKDRAVYLNLLNAVLSPGGFVIIATFAVGGLTQCSGLDIQQYTAESLSQFLGDAFILVQALDHVYTTTWGQDRPFLYCVFQKRDSVVVSNGVSKGEALC
jgi:SAM-dependent methyltransferase